MASAEEEIHKVYVRGSDVGEQLIGATELRESFAKFGEIVKVDVHHGKHFAFVQFAKKEDAQASVDAMQGAEINGCRIQAEMARTRRERVPGQSREFESKPGDWKCSKCRASNFARRSKCFMCHMDKTDAAIVFTESNTSSGRHERRYDDDDDRRRSSRYDDHDDDNRRRTRRRSRSRDYRSSRRESYDDRRRDRRRSRG